MPFRSLIALAAGLLLTAAGPPMVVPDGPAAASGRARALVRPVREAIRAKQAEQAALPAPGDDAQRLLRMADLDQTGRAALYDLDLSVLAPADRRAAHAAAWAYVEQVDRANAKALSRMMPVEGWFSRTRYGEAAHAAWLIVIHAVHDRALMARALKGMEQLLPAKEVDPAHYASLWDRLAVLKGRPQRYGTQPVCRNGEWVLAPLEAPDVLAQPRLEIGLSAKPAFATDGPRPPCF